MVLTIQTNSFHIWDNKKCARLGHILENILKTWVYTLDRDNWNLSLGPALTVGVALSNSPELQMHYLQIKVMEQQMEKHLAYTASA